MQHYNGHPDYALPQVSAHAYMTTQVARMSNPNKQAIFHTACGFLCSACGFLSLKSLVCARYVKTTSSMSAHYGSTDWIANRLYKNFIDIVT